MIEKYVELRWALRGPTAYQHTSQGVLEYRSLQPRVDASGALCPGEWSEWAPVPRVNMNMEQLRS